ncbi:penicillin-binding protein 2 [Nocardioides sp. SYSU D00038]|uniref:peptidoglycan D,D-transpeptidase FtsI family protein n=1 Tax=Nocardioides sp. SYSU D00038 TaxID=2812554 RepID=UPI0019670EA3|nr:penicillin-binding protein 2 [Nocardioides sp. SYSU D00038]
MRVGFLVIAAVLSVFGGRLLQLQGVDPGQYAAMAAAENTVEIVLPAERGDILDRRGEPLAASVEGLMVVGDPSETGAQAPEIATFLAQRLGVDYFETLSRLRKKDSKFQYLARRVPSTLATDVMAEAEAAGLEGLSTRRDPVRTYPADDVAANLIGFVGTDEALGGFERTFDTYLSGKDGTARYEADAGTRIPLGDNTTVEAVDGKDLRTTIDRELQWYTQGVVRQAVLEAGGESGLAAIMDTRTGEVLALADYPTYDANKPGDYPRRDRGARSLNDHYEPGSVEKVLTLSALVDAGKVTARTRLRVPGELERQDRTIHDYFEHGLLRMTLAGVMAKSSNIGTVLAADRFDPGQLRSYLTKFGLGTPTGVGIGAEAPGLLPSGPAWTSQTADRIAFGQSLSVNALQMTAAVNTIANGGRYVSPSLVSGSATMDDGTVVGTDTSRTRRVVSEDAATQTMRMMERVIDPEVGVAPGAAVPGYRVAGKTGTAQRASSACGCYDGTFTVSFGGFAPADDPRFTIYVAVQAPRNGGGGGSVAGPVFSKLMAYTLERYGVRPTGTRPSQLPTTW